MSQPYFPIGTKVQVNEGNALAHEIGIVHCDNQQDQDDLYCIEFPHLEKKVLSSSLHSGCSDDGPQNKRFYYHRQLSIIDNQSETLSYTSPKGKYAREWELAAASLYDAERVLLKDRWSLNRLNALQGQVQLLHKKMVEESKGK